MDKIALTNIADVPNLLVNWQKAKETVAALGAKHTAIKGSIDDLNRHLHLTQNISHAMDLLAEEATNLLQKITDEDIEYKRLDAVLDEKYTELRSALKTGLDLLRDIEKIRMSGKSEDKKETNKGKDVEVKDTIELSVADLVDATQTLCPNLQIRQNPSINHSNVTFSSSAFDKPYTPGIFSPYDPDSISRISSNVNI
jgi:hypothetical protein